MGGGGREKCPVPEGVDLWGSMLLGTLRETGGIRQCHVLTPILHCLGCPRGRVTAEKFQVLLLAAQPAPMVTENSLRQRRQQTKQERMRPIPIFFLRALSLPWTLLSRDPPLRVSFSSPPFNLSLSLAPTELSYAVCPVTPSVFLYRCHCFSAFSLGPDALLSPSRHCYSVIAHHFQAVNCTLNSLRSRKLSEICFCLYILSKKKKKNVVP